MQAIAEVRQVSEVEPSRYTVGMTTAEANKKVIIEVLAGTRKKLKEYAVRLDMTMPELLEEICEYLDASDFEERIKKLQESPIMIDGEPVFLKAGKQATDDKATG